MARITEKIRIRVDRCEPSSPFYVAWANNRGGWDFWLFDVAQEWGGSVSRSSIYQPYFSNLSTATTNSRALITEARQSVTCFAENITTQEVDGLETLLYSPRVYWLKDKTNNLWQEVIPDVGSYNKYATDGDFHDLTIRFRLPNLNIPSN